MPTLTTPHPLPALPPQDCYNSSSFAAISLCLNGYTHGPVHIKIGGEWGISQEDQGMAQDYNFLVPFLLLVKNLWRHGVSE